MDDVVGTVEEGEVIFPSKAALKTAQIGASGVLLIQYQLLKRGIESAPMTTDDGIDLVVYAPATKEALTVQVKTCRSPKPAGGKGRPALDWWLPNDSPAQLVGLVDLRSESAWLFRHNEFEAKAQQKPQGRMHLYFYTDPTYQPAKLSCERLRGLQARAPSGCTVRNLLDAKLTHTHKP